MGDATVIRLFASIGQVLGDIPGQPYLRASPHVGDHLDVAVNVLAQHRTLRVEVQPDGKRRMTAAEFARGVRARQAMVGESLPAPVDPPPPSADETPRPPTGAPLAAAPGYW